MIDWLDDIAKPLDVETNVLLMANLPPEVLKGVSPASAVLTMSSFGQTADEASGE